MPFIANNLHMTEALLRAVIGTAVDGIMVIDEKGTVRLYNPACERLFGYTPKEVIGNNVKMLMPARYRDEHDGYLERYLETREAHVIGAGREVTGRRKDGSEFPVRLSVGEAWYDDNRYFVGIVHDRTEQKLTEDSLRAAKDEAESASRAKSDFLAVMSHEVRTPLHGIMATTSLLQRAGLKPKLRRYADTIQESCNALLEIVDSVLDLSRIESGAVVVKQATFRLTDLLDSVEALWEPRIREKGLEFFARTTAAVPRTVVGDADRIREILNNLVSNAIRFTEAGHVAVSVDIDKATDGAGSRHVVLRFEVTDTGIGIDPAHHERLFGRFEQADISLTRRHGGSGLGLAICKEIVHLLGGEIGLDSRPGSGSRFWFTIPCLTENSVPPNKRGVPRKQDRAAGKRPLSVLVAEDNAHNQVIIRDILSQGGHDVHIVPNGKEAVRAVIERDYDVILMDVRMPVMDGFEAARKIRETLRDDPPVHIVALTAHATKGARDQCLAAGMDDYISKPFTIAQINEVLEKYGTAA